MVFQRVVEVEAGSIVIKLSPFLLFCFVMRTVERERNISEFTTVGVKAFQGSPLAVVLKLENSARRVWLISKKLEKFLGSARLEKIGSFRW